MYELDIKIKTKNKKSLADLSQKLGVETIPNFLGENNVTDE